MVHGGRYRWHSDEQLTGIATATLLEARTPASAKWGGLGACADAIAGNDSPEPCVPHSPHVKTLVSNHCDSVQFLPAR